MQVATYQTYKFYTKKNQRLAIFANQNANGNINITVIPCNKTDRFIKDVAKHLLSDSSAYKEEYRIPGENQEDFLRWCRMNYHQKLILKLSYKEGSHRIVKFNKRAKEIELLYK